MAAHGGLTEWFAAARPGPPLKLAAPTGKAGSAPLSEHHPAKVAAIHGRAWEPELMIRSGPSRASAQIGCADRQSRLGSAERTSSRQSGGHAWPRMGA